MPACFFFFFNDTATTEIYTLSLHDALPISRREDLRPAARARDPDPHGRSGHRCRHGGNRGCGSAQGPEGGHNMRAVLLAVWLVAPGVLFAQGGSSTPKDTAAAKKPDPPAPPVNHLETTLAGFKLTGFAEGSYSYSGHSIGGSTIVGRLYDRLQNRFMLNALAVVLDKPYDATKFSAGFHTEVLIGQDATVIQSDGGTFNLGPQGDIPHLYVTLNVPTSSGNGLQFKVGRMVTLMGVEVIATIANPNWS